MLSSAFRYNKDKTVEEEARAAEIRQIKQQEEDALGEALGYAPRNPNLEPIDPNKAVLDKAAKERDKERHRAEKEERRKERAAKREERDKARTEAPSSSRHRHRDGRDDGRARRERSPRERRERDDRGDRERRGEREDVRVRSHRSGPDGTGDRSGRGEWDPPRRADRDLPPHAYERGNLPPNVHSRDEERGVRGERECYDREQSSHRLDERKRQDDRPPPRERSRSPRR